VRAAAATNSLPLSPSGINGGSFSIESQPRTSEDAIPPVTMFTAVSPGFFETMGVPLVQGRAPDGRDDQPAANAVWVNREFVRRYMSDVDPLRERVQLGGGDAPWREIAGVVGDVRTFGLDEEVPAMVYVPMAMPERFVGIDLAHIVVHTAGPPESILPQLRAAVARVDGRVPLTTARTMTDVLAESMAETSFTVAVLGIAAVISLLLGAIGLYGVIAYVVAQRTREIGVRMALGAPPAGVRRMVLRQGLRVVAAGAVIGLGGALALTRFMRGVLFEVPPFDPLTYLAVLLVLLLVSTAAAWLPARRASRIDVVTALHTE
jgi:predicted permease